MSPTSTFNLVGITPDTNTPSLTYFVVPVVLPSITSPHAVIQVVYNTDNSNVPAQFFQCSDFAIV